jgi:hypothetical protein
MIPPLTTFYLEGLSKDIIDGFTALQGTDEWKSAESYRRQIALVVEALHLGPIKVTFAEIGRLFGKSKGAIFREYEKSQRRLLGHGQARLLSECQLEAVGMFALECFENGTPATYDAIAHFINSEMSISVSLDALRHILLRHPCLKTVVGIPMERERVELDPREIEEFYDCSHR